MPRPILAPARRLVPKANVSGAMVPAELTAPVSEVVTAWPSPRIRSNRHAHPGRTGVVLTIEIDRHLYEAVRALVAHGSAGTVDRTRTIQAVVIAALRAFLRQRGGPRVR